MILGLDQLLLLLAVPVLPEPVFDLGHFSLIMVDDLLVRKCNPIFRVDVVVVT